MTPEELLSVTDELEDLRKRAEQCVTHHPGCDCREYRLAALEAENERLAAENAELWAKCQSLHDQLTVWRRSHEELGKALDELAELEADTVSGQGNIYVVRTAINALEARLAEAEALLTEHVWTWPEEPTPERHTRDCARRKAWEYIGFDARTAGTVNDTPCDELCERTRAFITPQTEASDDQA